MTPLGSLSTARMARLDERMKAYVDRGEAAGLVLLVSRRDQVHVAAYGVQDLASGAPMQRDTIVRIASMTKPILAAAALMLVEETRLRLDDPVDPWLPELADRRVLRALDGPADDTVPAERPITLRDILTLRLGYGALMAEPGTYPIQAVIEASGIEPGHGAPAMTPDQWMARLGALPQLHQPGERWLYHTGYDVLGVPLARVAGQPLERFLTERLFAPLAMRDTAFSVPEPSWPRLAACYAGGEDGALALSDPGPGGRFATPPLFSSEVVSTVDDYHGFGRMLLHGGRAGRERLLSRPSVELMMTDQITPAQKASSPFFPGFWDNTGWGMGVSVITRRDSTANAPGRIGWDGGFGTSWFADPREELNAMVMVQREYDEVVGRLHLDFSTLVYQAIDD